MVLVLIFRCLSFFSLSFVKEEVLEMIKVLVIV